MDDYEELDANAESARTAAAAGYRTAVAAAASLHGSPWGYIAAARHEPHSFPPNAESILEQFAALVTLALAQADALAELQRQAITDGLTGLLNHRAFRQRLHEEFARARRHDRPLSLVMLDLDNLKLVNDLHGHSAGDLAIETVGHVLREGERTDDVAARVGGDEFAVIVPETTAQDALALAERLRVTAAARLANLELPASLSAGVSDLTYAATINDLARNADSALYVAKHNGGDQAVRYTPVTDQHPDGHDSAWTPAAQTALTALIRAVDAKDSPTQRHSDRVANICAQLAVRLGWSPQRCARLREAALLHDVGKIGVPDTILSKPGALTDQEYEQVKAHAHLGAEIVAGILDPEQASWVRGHHERPDGRGYPDALTAPDIPDGALIIATADAYDTITSGRPYRPAMAPADAIAHMRARTGTQFDPGHLDALEDWALQASAQPSASTPEAPTSPRRLVSVPASGSDNLSP